MYDFIHCPSPIGMLTMVAQGDGLTALVRAGQKHEEKHLAGTGRERETPVLYRARLWLMRYFEGVAPNPFEIPLRPKGTDFQKKVWCEIQSIPYGETATYGAIAARLATSPRAVGGAAGRNPLMIFIPCHRVLASDGSLTGYAGGLAVKEKLLHLEAMGCSFRED